MTELFVSVVLLSLAAAISPVVLMIALALMAGERPVFRSGWFAVGVQLTTVALFGIGMLAIRLQRDGLEPGPLGSPAAHLLVGLGLIAAGIGLLVFVHPNADRAREFKDRYLTGDRPRRDFAIAGVIVMITNASSLVVVIAIIHEIAREAPGRTAEAAVAFLLAMVITALPGTAPFAAALIGGAGLQRRLGWLGTIVARRGRYVMAALWIAFGVKDVIETLTR